MSKERLEEIEKNLDPLGYGMGGHLISVNDIYWLVRYAKEQSERVQELEEELYGNGVQMGYKRMHEVCNRDYAELLGQNKRYREYLELIRITGTHGKDIKTGEIIRSDEANLADEALEDESNELG